MQRNENHEAPLAPQEIRELPANRSQAMRTIVRVTKLILDYMFSLFFAGVYCILAMGVATDKSRLAGKPRVLWGPVPLRNYKYNAQALQLLGYQSDACVHGLYSINKQEDFRYYYRDLLPGFLPAWMKARLNFLAAYWVFAWFLANYDVLVTTFDGALLAGTRLRFAEAFWVRLAGKKWVVWPYGSDSFVYSQMQDHSFRYALLKSYPDGAKRDAATLRQIQYFTENADFVVGNIPHNEACPRWDLLTMACYGVDVNEWQPSLAFRHTGDGTNDVVRIIHCPNHRGVKGTEFLIRACDELKAEGLKVELLIIEGMLNEKLREIMKSVDIVAAQFLYGYAATEIEGMSLAKPVLSNLENEHYYLAARRYTYLRECPIVSTSPETIKDNLRRLVVDPGLRADLGRQGREYAIRYHSLEGQGLLWSKIVDSVWQGRQHGLDEWWHERKDLCFEEVHDCETRR